jgi:metacaspase-1
MARLHYLGIALNRVSARHYGGWEGRLNACHKDIAAIDRLIRALGVDYRTEILFDAQANIGEVEQSYAKLAQAAQPGDLVVIAHSRHGGQFRDESGDESDGWDETLVLWDGQVPDDVHAAWLGYFKPGVRVLLLVDSCHSETMARGLVAAAGFSLTRRAKALPRLVALDVRQQQAAQIRQMRAKSPAPITPRAAVISLSACKDNQVAMDGDENGEFTGALLRAWDSGRFSKGYGDFIKAIRKRCDNQTPCLTAHGDKRLLKTFKQQRPFTL